MPIEITEIGTEKGFLALESEWNGLLARSAFDAPFLRHEWLRTWWRHFSPTGRLCVLIGRENGRLILAWPMFESTERIGPLRVPTLRSLTNTHSFRFHLLVEQGKEKHLGDAWAYLRRRPGWQLLLITDVPLDVGLHGPLLQRVRGDHGLAGVWHAFDSAYIVPAGTWQEHEQRVSKSVRKRLRSQRNRLERQGDVRLEVLTDPAEIAGALPDAFDIERRSWKGAHGSAIACDQARLDFYTEFAMLAADRGWMRLAFLKVGDARAAFEYGIEYNRRLYSIKIGYDADRFGKFSPGRIAVMDSIARCFEKGLDEYDFIGPLTPAHEEWKPQSREIAWIFLFRKNLIGRLLYALKFLLLPSCKRVLQRLRWKKS